MSWEMVDEGWGNDAAVWAYTNEPRFRPEYEAVFDATGLRADTSYCDIACGSGFAAFVASGRGAVVHGIDASNRLLDIATARIPAGDLRHGDMFDLPWSDGVFDVVTSFRGLWGNTAAAMGEAARVLRPSGVLGLSFWPDDVLESPTAKLWYALSPGSDHEVTHTIEMASIANVGRAEEICRAAGLRPSARRRVDFVTEGPDVDFEVRAVLASGPGYLAARERGREAVERAVREAVAEFESPGLGVRIPTTIEYLVAEKPSDD